MVHAPEVVVLLGELSTITVYAQCVCDTQESRPHPEPCTVVVVHAPPFSRPACHGVLSTITAVCVCVCDTDVK